MKEKESFKRVVAKKIAFDGAFQRNAIYSKDIEKEKKKAFKNFLRNEMDLLILELIKNNLTDDQYVERLIGFADRVNKENKKVLIRKMNLGTAQKLINLYWKMLWLFGLVEKEPIHCPFDSIVIKMLPNRCRHIKWTKITKSKEYEILVSGAREIANGTSLTMWELTEYENAIA